MSLQRRKVYIKFIDNNERLLNTGTFELMFNTETGVVVFRDYHLIVENPLDRYTLRATLNTAGWTEEPKRRDLLLPPTHEERRVQISSPNDQG